MPTLRQYLDASPDLDYVTSCCLEGTCPVCGDLTLIVRLLDTRGTRGISEHRFTLEPFCAAGCTAGAIEAAVTPAVSEAKAA